MLVVHRKTDLRLEMCLQVICWCCSLFGLLQENTIYWVVSKQQEFIHHSQEDWEVQDESATDAVSGGGHSCPNTGALCGVRGRKSFGF